MKHKQILIPKTRPKEKKSLGTTAIVKSEEREQNNAIKSKIMILFLVFFKDYKMDELKISNWYIGEIG